MPRYFMPQSVLEEWVVSEQADLKDGKLVVPGDQASFTVTQAVHFTKVVSGADDAKLVDKVKTDSQLEKLSAEHMADSVLLGENAYEVVPGYVVDAPAPPPKDAKKKASSPEADLLADFLLNKL